MKAKCTLIIFHVSLACSCLAQVSHDFEARRQSYDRNIRAAILPINKEYETDLEQLLKKANQANDLTTAIKIKEAISRLKNYNTTYPVIGKWEFYTKDFKGTRVINEDGTYSTESGEIGYWTVSKGKLTLTTSDKARWIEFDLPEKNGILTGRRFDGVPAQLHKK